jgi:O-antigen ligase
MNLQKDNQLTSNRKWLYIFLTVFLFVVNLYGKFVMLIASVAIVATYALYNKGKIRWKTDYTYIFLIFSFALYNLISALWARNYTLSVSMGFRMIEISVIMIFFYNCFCEEESIQGILKSIMYSGYMISIYTIYVAGWENIYRLVQTAQRINFHYIDTLNANTIGAFSAYSIIINAYLIIYIYNKFRFTDLLIIPAIFTLIVSQSRKGFVSVIIGIVLLLVLKNVKLKTKNQFLKSIFALAFLAIIIMSLIKILANMYIFSLIIERFKSLELSLEGGKGDAVLRIEYVKLGLKLFANNPVIGVGSDNARFCNYIYLNHEVYLHNNYVELLADGGIIGLILYYFVFVVIIYKMVKYREYRDGEYDICIILIAVRLLMDVGQVTYYDKTNAMYILMFWLEMRNLEKRVCCPGK